MTSIITKAAREAARKAVARERAGLRNCSAEHLCGEDWSALRIALGTRTLAPAQEALFSRVYLQTVSAEWRAVRASSARRAGRVTRTTVEIPRETMAQLVFGSK